ncbi:hypothetical protein CWI38_1692p0020 [Hamiltosporidium tvaerminnensis]|uniref:Uncharacterized protein n=1 Tax=Hamiltosporidium tvaerminnensis TaxID=1176355 RepID=A0A4Q9LQ05_9MICR|nr:hypothetical protein CWI38_1692p0020 [Hamiltosporidium tvaerminnensis]
MEGSKDIEIYYGMYRDRDICIERDRDRDILYECIEIEIYYMDGCIEIEICIIWDRDIIWMYRYRDMYRYMYYRDKYGNIRNTEIIRRDYKKRL